MGAILALLYLGPLSFDRQFFQSMPGLLPRRCHLCRREPAPQTLPCRRESRQGRSPRDLGAITLGLQAYAGKLPGLDPPLATLGEGPSVGGWSPEVAPFPRRGGGTTIRTGVLQGLTSTTYF